MFQEFPKITRFLEQDVCITEKLDGTNACIIIGDSNENTDNPDSGFPYLKGIQSRKRLITPDDDNYGFAKWVHKNEEELVHGLGVGYHYGEWWGSGIQRNYNMTCKVFSLFNTHRWSQESVRPSCCDVVPIQYSGTITPEVIEQLLAKEEEELSLAALKYGIRYNNPEGYMLFFTKVGMYFKSPFEKGSKG